MAKAGRQFKKRINRLWTGSKAFARNSGKYLDEAIAQFAPGWGLKRQALRELKALHERQSIQMSAHWEGAENDRLRAGKWMGSRLSPDSAMETDLESLRENADELYRSFSYANGAIECRTDNVIGTGIRPKARIKAVEGLIDDDQAKLYNGELNALFRRMAPLVGPSGRESFWDVQRQVERFWKRDGEAFVVFSDVGRADKPIPLQVQTVDARRVETPPEKEGDPLVRLGIERTRTGEIVRYWIRDSHPFDTKDVTLTYSWFPADRVVHIYEKLYADQSRGLPWFAAVLNEYKDFKDFREATIISAQVAACLTLIISTDNAKAIAAAGVNSDGNQELAPGKIMYTSHADEVKTVTPNQPSTTFGMFSEWNLMGLSAGLNWPFGWLTKDRRRSTFSSGKLEEIDGGMAIRADQLKIRDRLLTPFWNRLGVLLEDKKSTSTPSLISPRSKGNFQL